MDRIKERKDLMIQVAEKAHESYLKESVQKHGFRASEVERMRNFVARETIRSSIPRNTSELQPLERMVGPTLDFKDFPPHELARRKGRPVARLLEVVDGAEFDGFGTGFLIAPNVLMTNHHVFPDKSYAMNCGANFLHEKDLNNHVLKGVVFKLDPDRFFYTFEDLDFTLVYVEDNSISENQKLIDLGILPLIGTKGKIIAGNPLSIIQHPLGKYKKYAYEQNTITRINDADGIIQYTTDTQPASSGSPGFNDAWEVVALHYTGVPSIVNGKWMTKTGKVWNKDTMSDDDVLWIGNAGKSVSKIVSHLKTLSLGANQQYIERIINNSGDPVVSAAIVQETKKDISISKPLLHNDTMETSGKLVLNFNGPTTVNINTSPSKELAVVPEPNLQVVEEAKMRFDENYSKRKGYDENFIDGFKVPMPTVIEKRKAELYYALNAKAPYLAKYHHYSLVMNKKRRLLMWSASNADYSTGARDKRDRKALGTDAWRLDKRIPEQYQIQAEEFYDPATLVDKGHIVRRDDNCWADDADSLGIEYANADTFHWTNCTPQHEEFNRDMMGIKGMWGILENEIKKQLDSPKDKDKDYGQRACILAGPVLDPKDPSYNDIQYPVLFWKVFAINSKSEGRLVYGFVLSQKDKVDELGLEEGLPRFNAVVKAMQKNLKDIEALSGVKFDATLHQYDVLQGAKSPTESLDRNMSNFIRTKATKVKKKK